MTAHTNNPRPGLREFVQALLVEASRHRRQSVLGHNAYYATCSCGEWRADQPDNFLTHWTQHRDDALLPLVREQVEAARRRGEATGLREAARRIEVGHPVYAQSFRDLADLRDRAARGETRQP